MNQLLPMNAASTQEIKNILEQCLAEYWAPRFNELTIDHCARMYAALQPFISYQQANCPVADATNQSDPTVLQQP